MKVAAIQYAAREGDAIDEVLRQAAEALKRDGYRLAGAVQINSPQAGFSRCNMTIEDLASGRQIEASDKSRAENGCRLDAYALEDAAGLVAQSIGPHTDLVIINRFGKQEALGQGFRDAIEAAVLEGVPLLTSYSANNAAAFADFSGGAADAIAADAEQIVAWARAAISAKHDDQ